MAEYTDDAGLVIQALEGLPLWISHRMETYVHGRIYLQPKRRDHDATRKKEKRKRKPTKSRRHP
jgi:inosine/xanthosine triphosphate pyrophosphatase family protein